MSSATIGAWVGAGLGLLNFAVLRYVAGSVGQGDASADRKRSATVIRAMALGELIVFPIVGYMVGPLVIEG